MKKENRFKRVVSIVLVIILTLSIIATPLSMVTMLWALSPHRPLEITGEGNDEGESTSYLDNPLFIEGDTKDGNTMVLDSNALINDPATIEKSDLEDAVENTMLCNENIDYKKDNLDIYSYILLDYIASKLIEQRNLNVYTFKSEDFTNQGGDSSISFNPSEYKLDNTPENIDAYVSEIYSILRVENNTEYDITVKVNSNLYMSHNPHVYVVKANEIQNIPFTPDSADETRGVFYITMLNNSSEEIYWNGLDISFNKDKMDLVPSEYVNYTGYEKEIAKLFLPTYIQSIDTEHFIKSVNQRVHKMISYDKELGSEIDSGNIDYYVTDFSKLLSNRTGICQDYAALLISTLRIFDIQAKYVTVLTDKGILHAVCEVSLPDSGEVLILDPTGGNTYSSYEEAQYKFIGYF